jgi:Rps23 Pro-64 3,4-dihydroxylase Tpa1-like proline 4-hydroxylase
LQVTLCREPFEYLIVDNTYTEEELKLIFLELDFWTISGNMKGPEHTKSAKEEDGSFKKKNKGVFLDNVYADRDYSNILKLNRKIYKIQLDTPSVILNMLKGANHDTTLVSYYENESHYKSHRDLSVLTAVTYLYKQPKVFEGGDLILTEYGYAFEPWFNRTYIMPGAVKHEVSEVKMRAEDCEKGLGRYCISNFIQQQDHG